MILILKKQLEGRDKMIEKLRGDNDLQMEEKSSLEKEVQKKISIIEQNKGKIQSLK